MARRWATAGKGRAAICATLIALTLLGAGLRIFRLDQGLWYDEIVTLVESVRPPLLQILSVFPGNNNHPLYSVLAHIAVASYGEHAWSLRLPAILFGIATIPMLYFVGAIVTSRREALLATALLVVSYHHIWFSQNARGYSALAFWALLTTYFLLRGFGSDRRGFYLGYALAAALGTYTHLIMVFVVASHAMITAWLLFARGSKAVKPQDWRLPALGLGLAAALSLLFYAPILVQVHRFFAAQPRSVEVATPAWAFWEAIRGLEVSMGSGGAALVAGVLLACGLWSYFKQSNVVFALFVLPGVVTGLAAVALRRPVFPRFFFFLIGFGLLIIVRGSMTVGNWIVRRWKSRMRRQELEPAVGTALVFLLLVVSSSVLPYGYRYPKQDFEQAMLFVEEQQSDGELVIAAGLARYPYLEYYRKAWESVESLEELQVISAREQRFWLVYTFPAYLEHQAPELMAAIRRDCPTVKTFHGTVAGGDIVVCRTDPRGQAP